IPNPSSKLKKAIEYAKKFQPRLENIYKIGELPLSNNPIEQVIRLSTLVRKNSLFARSVDGAKASAIFYSLVQTAKLNGLDIFKYFNYIFSLLEKRENRSEERRVGKESRKRWSAHQNRTNGGDRRSKASGVKRK